MKLLVIDYMPSKGHRVFNKIHIDVISRLEIVDEVLLMSVGGFFDYIEGAKIRHKSMPSWMFASFKNAMAAHFLVRLFDIFKLAYLKYYLIKEGRSIDGIVFLDYDIMSLFTFKTKKKVYLINHFNIDDLDNGIKRILTSHLKSSYIHVNFNNYIDNRLKTLIPSCSSYVIPHGINFNYLRRDKRDISSVTNGDRFIFCPIASSCDSKLLNDLFSDREVLNYIREKNFCVLLKGNAVTFNETRVKNLPSSLDEELYETLLSNAFAVLLPYDRKFNYRVSGILHECFAHNVPVLTSPTKSFEQYKAFINYDFLVSNSSELISVLDTLSSCKSFYRDLEALSPEHGWNRLLSTTI